jgi:hypothetical protein
MLDDKDRYRPRRLEELEVDPIPLSLINEPVPPENVSAMPVPKARALHAVLVESLTNTRALLQRLELGVQVARAEQREVVRLLYVATRNQAAALAATLELEGSPAGGTARMIDPALLPCWALVGERRGARALRRI